MANAQILVVEDEGIVAMDIQKRLERLSYSVPAVVDTGEDAIKKAGETHPDLVLMDIHLKGEMTGIEAAEQIRNAYNIPVLYLTAYADDETLERAKITEPYGYILKPFKDRELHSNIDIALHKHKIDRELRSSMKALEQANRELKNYAYTISHDLRDPLGTIQAFSEFVLHEYMDKLDERGENQLAMLQKSVSRIVELIEDLLILSRIGMGYIEVETVDLNALLNEITSELSAQIAACGGEVVATGQLPTISAFRVWMKELLLNLIENGLTLNKSEKPRVEVSCDDREKENDYLFMVKDNGIGIEEENQARIFNLVDTPLLEFGNVAVGLAICKRIVTEFGGTIGVESKTGEGRTFRFTIPKLYQYFGSV